VSNDGSSTSAQTRSASDTVEVVAEAEGSAVVVAVVVLAVVGADVLDAEGAGVFEQAVITTARRPSRSRMVLADRIPGRIDRLGAGLEWQSAVSWSYARSVLLCRSLRADVGPLSAWLTSRAREGRRTAGSQSCGEGRGERRVAVAIRSRPATATGPHRLASVSASGRGGRPGGRQGAGTRGRSASRPRRPRVRSTPRISLGLPGCRGLLRGVRS